MSGLSPCEFAKKVQESNKKRDSAYLKARNSTSQVQKRQKSSKQTDKKE